MSNTMRDTMIREAAKRSRNSKITCALFLFVALPFVIFSANCFAELPLPSSDETVLALLQDPLASSSPGFNSSRPGESVDLPVGPVSPAQEASRPVPERSETVIILWQAAKTEDPADSGSDRTEASPDASPDASKDTDAEDTLSEETIADPLEPVNRVFFVFNDKFYFWAVKPVSSVYRDIFPQELRVGIRNFFSNLLTPVRFANCLLQGEFKGAGNEAARFGINTTFGFLGMVDQAKDKFQIEKEDRDFGQTLGIWGLRPLLYIEWPILGPSNVRDTAGFVGDLFLDPRTYLLDFPVSLAVRSTEVVNNTSLLIGEYESLKKAAIDPYVAKRDAYTDYRQNKINKRK
jgi:phospholipid-binding lipoprotein MlaA